MGAGAEVDDDAVGSVGSGPKKVGSLLPSAQSSLSSSSEFEGPNTLAGVNADDGNSAATFVVGTDAEAKPITDGDAVAVAVAVAALDVDATAEEDAVCVVCSGPKNAESSLPSAQSSLSSQLPLEGVRRGAHTDIGAETIVGAAVEQDPGSGLVTSSHTGSEAGLRAGSGAGSGSELEGCSVAASDAVLATGSEAGTAAAPEAGSEVASETAVARDHK